MKTVFTNGCFDILHRGHFELLKYCKSLGHVIVGLNSDRSVKMNKGKSRPWNDVKDRKFMLESCKYVDEVVIGAPYIVTSDMINSLNIQKSIENYHFPNIGME